MRTVLYISLEGLEIVYEYAEYSVSILNMVTIVILFPGLWDCGIILIFLLEYIIY